MTCLEQYISPGVERLLPLFSDTLEPLFNYLPPDAVLVLDEPAVINTELEEFATASVEVGYQQALLRKDLVAPPTARYLSPSQVTECFQVCQRIVLQTLAGDLSESQETELLTGHVLGSYQGRWETLVQLMATRLQEGHTVPITAASLTQARHIQDLLREAEPRGRGLDHPPNLLAALAPALQPTPSPTHAARGPLRHCSHPPLVCSFASAASPAALSYPPRS